MMRHGSRRRASRFPAFLLLVLWAAVSHIRTGDCQFLPSGGHEGKAGPPSAIGEEERAPPPPGTGKTWPPPVPRKVKPTPPPAPGEEEPAPPPPPREVKPQPRPAPWKVESKPPLAAVKPGPDTAADEKGFTYRTITKCRAVTVSLEKFGGVGDGATSNTKAFSAAVEHLAQVAPCSKGGGQLYVPPGKWVTGSFNLTSCFTLYLHRDATVIGSKDMAQYPLIKPLPSYGRGRDAPGGRYSSLIMGSNLTDVAITGDNGTIDGQGRAWWSKFHSHKLKNTRGHLVELLYSSHILISNLTFVDSPSWNIHPVYSSYIVVSGITIQAPLHSPNTDGINPDSCSDVRIEDCYVVSGDDCVAIKSGWDEYGIAVGMPSQRISIRRLTCISPTSAVIALGSEMSGGIRDVRAEHITAITSESGVRIKTAIGRGAYVKDIYVRGFVMTTMKWAFWMTGNYNSHPDDHYDPKAIPVVSGISYSNIVARNASKAGRLEGIPGAPFTGICISNATIEVVKSMTRAWTCTNVKGSTSSVTPQPCPELAEERQAHGGPCPFPEGVLPIDEVQFHQCSASIQ